MEDFQSRQIWKTLVLQLVMVLRVSSQPQIHDTSWQPPVVLLFHLREL